MLSRNTFHHFNRVSLLGLMLVSLLLPLCHIPLPQASPAAVGMVNLESLMSQANAQESQPESGITFTQAAFAIYLAGTLFFLGRELLSLHKLRQLVTNAETCRVENGIHTIVLDKDVAPFSWLHYIFISRKDFLEDPQEILLHEQAHISHHHSLDILFCDLLMIFQWFNPAAWLMRKELQDIHEYEADESVLASGVNAREYQLLLIRKAVGEQRFTMANHFNHSSLKKRINMMLSKKSNPWCRAKLLVTIPVATLAVVAFASEKAVSVSQEIEAESNQLMESISQEKPRATTQKASIAPSTNVTKQAKQKTDKKKKEAKAEDDNFEKALVIIDGKVVSADKLTSVLPNDIININIYKGKAAIDLYGEKAANGAIVIATKNNDTASKPTAKQGEADSKTTKYMTTIQVNQKEGTDKVEPEYHYYVIDGDSDTPREVKNLEKYTHGNTTVTKYEYTDEKTGSHTSTVTTTTTSK